MRASTLRPLPLLLLLACAACTSSAGVPDAAPGPDVAVAVLPCQTDPECPQGLFCVDSRCTDVCAGIAGGTPCNVGFVSSTGIPECCGPESKCCDDGFEHEGCYPADAPCPKVCANTFSSTCAGGERCLYEADPDFPGSGQCSWGGTQVSCVDACPEGTACGSGCCGEGTVCVESCCVVPAPVDAGL